MRASLILVILVSLIALSTSIYEDQVGLYDWHHTYVGKPLTQVVDKRAILVTTEQRILAALCPKTGSIQWKYKFTPQDDIIGQPALNGDSVVTLHETGHFRHWDIETGLLLQDTKVNEGSELLTFVPVAGDNIVKFTRNRVYSGDTSVPVNIPSDMAVVGQLKFGSIIELLLIGDSKSGLMVTYDAKEGSVSTSELDFRWADNNAKLEVSDSLVAALVGDTIYSKTVGDATFYSVPLSDMGINWSATEIKSAGKSAFVVTGKEKSVVLVVKDGVLKPVKAMNKNVVGVVTGSDHIILMSLSDNTVTLVQLSNGYEHHSYELGDMAEGRGSVVSVNILPSSHPCSLVTSVKVPGLLMTWEDGSITVAGSTDKCGWIREESLASVVSATMLDLPASSVTPLSLKTQSNPLAMWTDRILNQLMDLQKLINIYFGSAVSEISPEMERDSFNLNKLIFVMTSSGKAHVLHSNNGRIIWSRYLKFMSPLADGKYQVHLLRSSSHYPLPALVAVLGASHNGENSELAVLNPMDGSIHYRSRLPNKLAQVQLTSVENNEFVKVLLILTQDNKIHTYPPNSHHMVRDVPIYFTLLHREKMQLTGYSMRGDQAQETWSTHIRGDKVVALETKATNDAVYSQGRVLGDRSVLHKYINPNIMALAVESGTADKVQVDVQLYDMVSGTQIYHSRHKQYSGPVHILVAENWLVYHFYSTKLRRYEVVAVEFFLPQGIKSSEFSSLNAHHAPITIQQSYISTSAISSLAVTTTLKSITNRAILFGDTNGRISLIPKAVLDPRRPAIPTAEDRVEQLIPYKPQLDVMPVSYVSYNRILENIQGMVTGVTGLESTSLLFVYGSDLFFTRVTPAKTFDMLNEDFDYYLIGMVLLGLCLGTIITQALAENKALNKKWK